jgi:hypothetical protein
MRRFDNVGKMIIVMVVVASSVCTSEAVAGDITRIEENWEFKVASTNLDKGLPAIIHAISPSSTTNGQHSVFLMNSWDAPSFQKGGMQLQSWSGDSLLDFKNHPQFEQLSTSNEVIKYTIAMEIINGNLVVEIIDGSSKTWGSFGGDLKIMTPTDVTNLNEYNSQLSLKNVGIRGAHNLAKGSLTGVKHYEGTKNVLNDKSTKDWHVYQAVVK